MPTFHPLPSQAALARPDSLEGELVRVIMAVNEGETPEQLVNILFETLAPFLPYDRISVALMEGPDTLVMRYLRSKGRGLWGLGSRGRVIGSSLEPVINGRQVRIIADMREYLREHPDSPSARHVVADGVRASLTLPLVCRGRSIGAVFFSSCQPDAYRSEHLPLVSVLASVLGLAFDRVELFAALRNANRELQSLDELKTNFLSNLSHELRTPLSVVVCYLATLQEEEMGPLNASQHDYMRIALDAAERLGGLLNDLLDFTELETGFRGLDRTETDLAAIVAEVLADQRDRLEAGGLHVVLEASPTPLPVIGDPPRLAQIVRILLDNARKFTPPPGTVRVKTERRGSQAVLEVVDTGVGIAPEHQGRMFDKFYQVDSSTTRKAGGVGLGLPLARAIVNAHGGTIGVISAPAKGSTFWVQLPLHDGEKGESCPR